MEMTNTDISDVKLLKLLLFGDDCGFFMETWRDNFFRQHVADVGFVQDNHSKSKKGLLLENTEGFS